MREYDIHDYHDLYSRKYKKSDRHPSMTMNDRAAQFAPFAALNNHKSMVEETERIVDEKKILSEDQILMINQLLFDWYKNPDVHYWISYFIPDVRKNGGSYIEKEVSITKINERRSQIYLDDGSAVSFADIYNLKII